MRFFKREELYTLNHTAILKKIESFSGSEKRQLSYEELAILFEIFSEEEIVELSRIIGYPVFTRLCMNGLNHKFVLIQDGASAIILNDKKQILLQRRVDNDKWGLPGGCQEIGERFEETVIREVKEETNLEVKEEDLKLVTVVSGQTRRRQYPNGDVVFNNSVLFVISKFTGELKCDEESKVLKFFDINDLPINQHDEDLIQAYKNYIAGQ